MVDDAFRRFGDRVPHLPAEPTAGSRQNVALAALTLSLLEALEHVGVERRYAIELTGDTCWRFTAAGARSPTRPPAWCPGIRPTGCGGVSTGS